MAAPKKTNKKTEVARWQVSWKNFFFAASVTGNVAFIVVLITMISSHALDGLFIKEGLNRYCDGANNSQFAGSTDQTRALREYTCAAGDAKQYFNDGFNKYLDFKAKQ